MQKPLHSCGNNHDEAIVEFIGIVDGKCVLLAVVVLCVGKIQIDGGIAESGFAHGVAQLGD